MITLRTLTHINLTTTKGSTLTHSELDQNFIDLERRDRFIPSPGSSLIVSTVFRDSLTDSQVTNRARGEFSSVLGGKNNIINNNATNSIIVGGCRNTINVNIENSVVLGGCDQVCNASNTAFGVNAKFSGIINAPNIVVNGISIEQKIIELEGRISYLESLH